MKNRLVVMDSFFKRYTVASKYKALFESLESNFGFSSQFSDVDIDYDNLDIVITIKSPQHTNLDYILDLDKLKDNTKVIGIFHDIHNPTKKMYYNMQRVLDRCDKILTPYYSMFLLVYPGYENKLIFFPHYFAIDKWYRDLKFNVNPIEKCLLVGSSEETNYPIRYKIKYEKNVHCIDRPDYHLSQKQYKKSM